MTRIKKLSWLLIALLLAALAACGGNANQISSQDADALMTQLMETALVAQEQTAQAASPTPTITLTPTVTLTPGMTNTPLISSTPEGGAPTRTPFALPTSASTSQAACDNATFITDVTYADGSIVPKNSLIAKTWRVRNDGPCTWEADYQLVWEWGGEGTNWSTLDAVSFSVKVLPGETLDITINLPTPNVAGNYAGVFRLQNNKGFNFGPTLTVVIEVQ